MRLRSVFLRVGGFGLCLCVGLFSNGVKSPYWRNASERSVVAVVILVVVAMVLSHKSTLEYVRTRQRINVHNVEIETKQPGGG